MVNWEGSSWVDCLATGTFVRRNPPGGVGVSEQRREGEDLSDFGKIYIQVRGLDHVP